MRERGVFVEVKVRVNCEGEMGGSGGDSEGEL